MIGCAIGAVGGFTQYLPVKIFKKALKLGPLSPVWCMFSLGSFIPVIVFSALFMEEALSGSQACSLFATCTAMVFASLSQESSTAKKVDKKFPVEYFICLLLIFFFSGVMNIGLKYSTTVSTTNGTQTLFDVQRCIIMCFAYLTIAVCASLDLSITGKWRFHKSFWIGGGVLSGAAVINYSIIIALIALPATLVFALGNTVSILLSSVLSSIVFREKRRWNWYAMLIFAVMAIVLNH